jgi:hypothetical protein
MNHDEPDRKLPQPPQPAVRIAIEVREDMARDVVIVINGVQVIGGGVDEEP